MAGSKILFESSVLTGNDPAIPFNVDISGHREIELVVTDGNMNGKASDHADWLDLKFEPE